MNKKLVFSIEDEESRAAILSRDDRLIDIYVDRPLDERVVGNIYKGKVENVLPGMQAAFVNIGLEKNGFLYVDDAYPAAGVDDGEAGSRRKNPSIRQLLRPGQEILVQITKEPSGTKGARITRNLSIPGRYLVFMPASDYVGVSRRIKDSEERTRLKHIAQHIKPKDMGVIVRTVAEGRNQQELQADIRYLSRLWKDVQRRFRRESAPALLHKDQELVLRLLRDHLTEKVDEVLIDSQDEYRRALELVETFSPQLKGKLHYYQNGNLSLFEKYGLNEQMENIMKRRVWLESGGYLVIDETEALTSIDINTGKYVGSKRLEDTVFKTNMEATGEIARQLRLRDIGGIIIIDFIDMERREHQKQVVAALEEALARDRTKTTVLGITRLGLVEMTRKKTRKSIQSVMTRECPYCEGRGHVLSEESMHRKVRREIKRILRHSNCEAILVEVHPSVAALLIGSGGANLKKLEKDTGKNIFIKGSDECHIEEMNLRALGTRQEVKKEALPVETGQTLELKVEEPHVSNLWDGIARVEGYVVDIEGAGDRVGERVQVEITRAYRTYAKGRIVEAG